MTFAAGALFLLAVSAPLPPPPVSDVEAGRIVFEGKGQCYVRRKYRLFMTRFYE
jgi:hypothetical protein